MPRFKNNYFLKKILELNKQFQVLNYARELHQGDLLKLHSGGISLKNKDFKKSGKNIDNSLEYPQCVVEVVLRRGQCCYKDNICSSDWQELLWGTYLLQ